MGDALEQPVGYGLVVHVCCEVEVTVYRWPRVTAGPIQYVDAPCVDVPGAGTWMLIAVQCLV
jgi:hypothetical protein